MQHEKIRKQWESAAPGWAQWETAIAMWMEPATETDAVRGGRHVRRKSARSRLWRGKPDVTRCPKGRRTGASCDSPEAVRVAAWTEVAGTLATFETPAGFIAPAEVLVAAGAKSA